MKVKLIRVLDDKSGTTANGTWRDVQFLVETIEDRPKKLALSSKGDACDKIARMKEGDVFNVQYDIQSNQSKDGRWFTKVVVWSVVLQAGDPPTSAYTGAGAQETAGPTQVRTTTENDELPF